MARRRFFDTNKLVGQLRKLRHDSTRAVARALARELIAAYDTNAILTPVEIEVLVGVRDGRELDLTERFLEEFEVIDRHKILPEDWKEARRIAKRVRKYDRDVPRAERKRSRERHPRSSARDFGDCLIVAIANRLHYEPITEDEGLTQQAGRAGPPPR